MAVPGERKPIDSSAVLTTVVLGALWGLQQTAIKAAAGDSGGAEIRHCGAFGASCGAFRH